ncbi:hypothetical protein P4114_02680 [Pseudomonas aeruginosa]|nr:hypothetical protein [Pseudomonas aeruginosa]
MHTLKRCMAAMVALLALSLAMTARAELPDFTPLVEQASPAVVNISTRQKLPDRAMARGQLSIPDLEGLPPMFRDFLERSIPQVPRNPRGQQREAQSAGLRLHHLQRRLHPHQQSRRGRCRRDPGAPVRP